MDFSDQITALAVRIPKMLDYIKTEEATKNALVMPFIAALGYNVFDPTEVVPEFTADVGTKKGEKVDYAILRDREPIMLFECKAAGMNLNEAHMSQLYRYYSVTPARLGVLTNGIVYRFYADLDEPNKMDEKPFLEFNLLDMKEAHIPEMKRFARSTFDIEKMLSAASELKYTKAIQALFSEQLSEPSDDFIKFFVSHVYPGRFTKVIRQQFSIIIGRALNQFISERINDRLKRALESGTPLPPAVAEPPPEEDDGIVTTDKERDGFNVVRAVLREVVDVSRVTMRDTKSYCGVLLDNNNRKPICRLHFNTAQKYLGVFDADKKEKRIPLSDVSDIFSYADELKTAARRHGEEEQ